MKNYSIKISGSGTPDQIATRLLEIARNMQVELVHGDFEKEFEDKTFEDDILITEIKEE